MFSQNDSFACDRSLHQIFADLATPARRKAAAEHLASYLSAERVFIFICDSDLNILLPAAGFPQTYPNGHAWHSFLEEVMKSGFAQSDLHYPVMGNLKKAWAVYMHKMALIALVDSVDTEKIENLKMLVPLLSIALHNERETLNAAHQLANARKRAEQLQGVSKIANAMRLELQEMVSALRENQKKLARSNEELAQFAYVASHDLQEPMRTISVFMELMNEEGAENLSPEFKKYMTIIRQSATRAQEMIRAFLDLAQMDKKPLHIQTIEVKTVLDQTLSGLARIIEESGARITYGNLPRVQADLVLLREVFQNLISNAIKFCDRKTPEIHVEVVKKNDQWLFSFADNGIGLNESDVVRIFGVFQRLHSASSFPGTGIGLSICKKVIELHGGRIWAESTLGRGTVFFFTLPLEQKNVHKKDNN